MISVRHGFSVHGSINHLGQNRDHGRGFRKLGALCHLQGKCMSSAFAQGISVGEVDRSFEHGGSAGEAK